MEEFKVWGRIETWEDLDFDIVSPETIIFQFHADAQRLVNRDATKILTTQGHTCHETTI